MIFEGAADLALITYVGCAYAAKQAVAARAIQSATTQIEPRRRGVDTRLSLRLGEIGRVMLVGLFSDVSAADVDSCERRQGRGLVVLVFV